MKYLNKIIEYGLYLLVFLLPVQTRWIIKAGELNGGYWEYGTISLYATDILLILLLFLFVANKLFYSKFLISPAVAPQMRGQGGDNSKFFPQKRDPAKAVINKSKTAIYWWLILGLVVSIFISIFFADNKLIAIYSYLRLLLGIGLFWLIVSSGYNKLKLIWSLLLSIFFQSGLAIWQFLNQSSFAFKWLGLALHQAQDLGTSVIETMGGEGIGERWLRAYGGLDHPNMLGGLLVVGLLLAIGLIVKVIQANNFQFFSRSDFSELSSGLSLRTEGSRTEFGTKAIFPATMGPRQSDGNFQFKKFKLIISIVYWLTIILFFIALIFSFSRAAWLAFFVAVFILLTQALVKKDLLLQKKLLEIILILGIVLFILSNLYQNLFLIRTLQNQRLEIKSYEERILSYKDFWQIIKNHWLVGTGIGNYTLVLHDQITNNYNSFYYQPIHNVFLLILAETGIISFIFFISLIIYLLMINFKFNNFNLSILIIIIFIMLLDHWWWSLHFGVLFFWLLSGLVIKSSHQNII